MHKEYRKTPTKELWKRVSKWAKVPLSDELPSVLGRKINKTLQLCVLAHDEAQMIKDLAYLTLAQNYIKSVTSNAGKLEEDDIKKILQYHQSQCDLSLHEIMHIVDKLNNERAEKYKKIQGQIKHMDQMSPGELATMDAEDYQEAVKWNSQLP